MVAMIYVDYTNFHPTLNSWTRSENASYQAIGRLGYALALAVVTLLCAELLVKSIGHLLPHEDL